MKNSKSSLFLIETIIAVLFFSICSAICVEIFAKAYTVSCDTQSLNGAVNLCTAAAELFYGYNGDLSKVQNTVDPKRMSTYQNGILTFYYDEKFNLCHMGDAAYYLNMYDKRRDDMMVSYISFIRCSDRALLYDLDCSLYLRAYNSGTKDASSSTVSQNVADPGTQPLDAGVVGGVL